MSDYAIEVAGLRHAFKGHKALQGTSFSVAKQSIHGFVGPNGAGKTTSLKVLATLLVPDAGTVRVFGHDVVREPDRVRQRIGFMPDHLGMYRQMTVGEYLDFFAAAYGLPVRERRRVVGDVLALTDMSKRADDLIKGLSKGMLQRVSLARTLVHDPDLLLLDEPAAGLDPRARIELMEILRELCSLGKTVFISSHILAELAEVCDAVTLMDVGKTKFSGPLEDLLKHDGEDAACILRLHEAAPPLTALLTELAGVSTVAEHDDGKRLVIRYQREECSPNQILGATIEAGVQIHEFHEQRRHLNEAFMSLTTAGVRS
ncbi:MAG: ABC transporter ATP-binding protein [Planctomycetota bacterium]|jgi:ABC-2 type transport system ATP-binding protein|nr:ABC transporter ATP-binding protein [Planctomycetota bacterium]